MTNSLAEHWLSHIRNDTIPFPRFVGFPFQYQVDNPEQFVIAIQRYLDSKDCFVRAFSEYQLEHKLYNKIYFDFDSKENLQLAHDELIFMYQKIKSMYNVEPRIYFTGSKGFHLYVDMIPTKINHFKLSLKSYIFKHFSNFKTLDFPVTVDRKRILRIPFTKNYSSAGNGRLCIPISIDWDLEKVLRESYYVTTIVKQKTQQSRILSFELIEIDEEKTKTASIENSSEIDNYKIDEDMVKADLDLIMQLAKARLKDGRSRLITFFIIPRLVHSGLSDDDITETCYDFVRVSGQSDLEKYKPLIRSSLVRTRRYNWIGWKIDTIIKTYPDIAQALGEANINRNSS